VRNITSLNAGKKNWLVKLSIGYACCRPSLFVLKNDVRLTGPGKMRWTARVGRKKCNRFVTEKPEGNRPLGRPGCR
jgi:hypothetical protein